MTGLAENRKLFTYFVAALISFGLNRAGMDASEFGADGPYVTAIVDFLMVSAIPAVFMWAQPNEKYDSILRWWKAVVVGLVIVAALIAGFVALQ